MNYYNKYLKYKSKYLQLQNQKGGATGPDDATGATGTHDIATLLPDIVYSINFVWLNKNIMKKSYLSQKYIFPFNATDKIVYLIHIIKMIRWAELHPATNITLWHDSSEIMVQNTAKLINELYNYKKLWALKDDESIVKLLNESISYDENTGILSITGISKDSQEILGNLHYKSIILLNRLQQIENGIPLVHYFGLEVDDTPLVKKYTDEALQTLPKNYNLPVYYRVDLIKIIIVLEQVETNPTSYAIIFDIDTTPLSKDVLFTKECFELLNEYGLVLPDGIKGEYENSFTILAGENVTKDKYMRLSIEKILVEFSIQKILHNNYIEPEDVFKQFYSLFRFYFAIVQNKSIRFTKEIRKKFITAIMDIFKIETENDAYHRITPLNPIIPSNPKDWVLNPKDLINLDMKLIGTLYNHVFKETKPPPGSYGYIVLFEDIDPTDPRTIVVRYIPVLQGSSRFSPHDFKYDIKYNRIKNNIF